MVVGNGLLSNTFKNYNDNDSVIIFASGVSNSKENDSKEFLREIQLLSSFFGTNSRLIYFSTCSIYDPSLSNSLYINHKLNVEKIIRENFKNYIIFRLPNVIGKSDNCNTSFNFFKERINKGLQIDIQRNSTRYFIDSEDLALFLPLFIEKSLNDNIRETINVVLDNKISIRELIETMEILTGKVAIKNYVDGGSNYDVDGSYFLNSISKYKMSSADYNYNLIKKYV